MALLTVEQLRANDSYIYGDATRYTVFERGDNLKETKNPPSLLLLLRNIDFDPSNINIDRLVNQIRQILRYDGAGLKQFDFDLVRGERRALWGNSQAQGFLNQANAAILKIQSLINKYEDRKEAHNQQAWFYPSRIRAAARQALGPIWAAFENIRQDVLIALNQRRLYGGITAYIWSRILGKIDTLTNLVRALVSITYVENDGQIKTWEIRFAHWTVKHGTTPATSFPGIRDPPGLSRASTATNVPPELDGGGPGPGPGEGGGGGNNDGGDSDNDDDNNNDNNNPGVNIWDDTQFDYNPGVNTNTNNNNNANINNNNNDNVNNDADEDDNDDDEDEDDDQDQDTYNLSGDEDSSDSDNDGYGGGGGAGGAAGGTTGGGLGGGGGGGGNIYVPPGRRTGGGVPPGPWMNRNWRDRSSAMVCKRCVQISGEEECPTCGGESTAIYPPAKGRKMQMKLKRAQENDGEIDSPNKRIRSLLASQVMIDRLSDELRVAKLNIREGPGTSMETMNFDYPDSFKQRGPEFQLPPKIGG
ncbi:hypothetical protein GQX73_g7127 [Xylaria multiplex]|uniref:Uncharacterized protein n=1 Tax=Xylaria multiplex TaxID=323545 RepID=A0A7C8MPS7_9PEZI|nr:hypothetical protein GQX73_g7127 [Xylaria multiplex]